MASQIEANVAEHKELLFAIRQLDDAPPTLEQVKDQLEGVQKQLSDNRTIVRTLEAKTKKEYQEWDELRRHKSKRMWIRLKKDKRTLSNIQKKEEREYYEAVEKEQAARARLAALEKQKADLDKEVSVVADEVMAQLIAELTPRVKRYNDMRARLTELYDRIFLGPSPNFPEEDAAETEFQLCIERYNKAQRDVTKEKHVLGLLTELAGLLSNAKRSAAKAEEWSKSNQFGNDAAANEGMERRDLSDAQRFLDQAKLVQAQVTELQPDIGDAVSHLTMSQSDLADAFYFTIAEDQAFSERIAKAVQDITDAERRVQDNLVMGGHRREAAREDGIAAREGLVAARDKLENVREVIMQSRAGSQSSLAYGIAPQVPGTGAPTALSRAMSSPRPQNGATPTRSSSNASHFSTNGGSGPIQSPNGVNGSGPARSSSNSSHFSAGRANSGSMQSTPAPINVPSQPPPPYGPQALPVAALDRVNSITAAQNRPTNAPMQSPPVQKQGSYSSPPASQVQSPAAGLQRVNSGQPPRQPTEHQPPLPPLRSHGSYSSQGSYQSPPLPSHGSSYHSPSLPPLHQGMAYQSPPLAPHSNAPPVPQRVNTDYQLSDPPRRNSGYVPPVPQRVNTGYAQPEPPRQNTDYRPPVPHRVNTGYFSANAPTSGQYAPGEVVRSEPQRMATQDQYMSPPLPARQQSWQGQSGMSPQPQQSWSQPQMTTSPRPSVSVLHSGHSPQPPLSSSPRQSISVAYGQPQPNPQPQIGFPQPRVPQQQAPAPVPQVGFPQPQIGFPTPQLQTQQSQGATVPWYESKNNSGHW